MNDKPLVRALVGYFVHPFGVVGAMKVVPLDLAVEYHRCGFVVLVDPKDEADLATWERERRQPPSRRFWTP